MTTTWADGVTPITAANLNAAVQALTTANLAGSGVSGGVGAASGLLGFDSAGYPIIGSASASGAPTVAVTNAGTGATATVDSWSSNVFGHVTSAAGTGGTTPVAVIHTVTLASSATFPANARVLILGASWGLIELISGRTTTQFKTVMSQAAAVGNDIGFYYLIVRNA